MNGHQALRSSSTLHVDEELATYYEELNKNSVQVDDDTVALQKIASLENHPGWKIIREQFVRTIEEYRSGRKLEAFCKDYSLTDAQIGQATRNMILVADELTNVLGAVEIAAQEVAREQKEQKNAANFRRMGRTTQAES